MHVDTDYRQRKAAAAARHDRLTLEPGDFCYFWRDEHGWSRGMEQWCRQWVKDTAASTMVDESSNK